MAVRRLLETEVDRDFQRENYEEVVRKQAGIVECMMYDHGAILDDNLWTCATYQSALTVLKDPTKWPFGNKELNFATTFIRRVEGIWLAWPRKSGIRQLIDEPKSTDFLTCSWTELGENPLWAKKSTLRTVMANRHAEAELKAQELELAHGPFLARCAHAAGEIFAVDRSGLSAESS